MSYISTIPNLLKWSIKQCLISITGAIVIMFIVGVPLVLMFSIAWMVDEYSRWWLIAYIPFFMVIAILIKSTATLFEDIIK